MIGQIRRHSWLQSATLSGIPVVSGDVWHEFFASPAKSLSSLRIRSNSWFRVPIDGCLAPELREEAVEINISDLALGGDPAKFMVVAEPKGDKEDGDPEPVQ